MDLKWMGGKLKSKMQKSELTNQCGPLVESI